MKKLLVVIVVLVALLALPFAAGMLVQSDLEQRVTSMNENGLVSAELTEYERGWRSSTARLELGLSQGYLDMIAANAGMPIEQLAGRLAVLIDVAHGPIAVDDGVHLGMAKIYARSDPEAPYMPALAAVGMPYLFEFHGRAGFGTFEFDADVPPADFASQMGEVTFSGITVDGSSSGRILDVRGNMTELAIDSPFLALTIDDTRIDTQTEFVPDRSYQLGKAAIVTNRIVATNPMLGGNPLFTLGGLRISTDTYADDDGDTLTAMVDYAADSVTAPGDFTMTDALLRLTLENLDAEAFETYSRMLQGAMQQQGADPEAMLAQLVPLAEQFLRAGPVLRMEPLQFSMTQGSFNGRVSVSVDGSAVPSAGSIDFENPALLISMLSADADARISKALAREIALRVIRQQLAASAAANGESPTPEEIDAMAEAQVGFVLASLTGTGMVTDAGDDYATNLSFANGQMLVNGAPLPFPLP